MVLLVVVILQPLAKTVLKEMVLHGVMEIVNGILQLRSAKRKVKLVIWKLLEKKLDFLSFFSSHHYNKDHYNNNHNYNKGQN